MTIQQIQAAMVARFTKMRDLMAEGLSGNNLNSPVRAMMTRWAARYAAFIRARYRLFSQGGGDWKDLAESTKIQRARALRNQASPGQPARERITARRRKFDTAVRRAVAAGGGSVSAIRRKVIQSMRFSILWDRGSLYRAAGSYVKHVPNGIEVGFGPEKHEGSNLTMAKIAKYHDQGGGKLPQRRLIVPPDANLWAMMREDSNQACRQILKESKP